MTGPDAPPQAPARRAEPRHLPRPGPRPARRAACSTWRGSGGGPACRSGSCRASATTGRTVFRAFLARHGIPAEPTLVMPGTLGVDRHRHPARPPAVHGPLRRGGLGDVPARARSEEAVLAGTRGLHVVLVEGAIRELRRLAAAGLTSGLEVTADFLSFRHYTLQRFAGTMTDVDVGFVGWPGDPNDDQVRGLRAVAHDHRKLVVATFGAHGVRVFDGRPRGRRPVRAGRGGAGPGHDGRLRGRVHRRVPGGVAGLAATSSRPWSAARSWAPRRPRGGARSPTRHTGRRPRRPWRPPTRRADRAG